MVGVWRPEHWAGGWLSSVQTEKQSRPADLSGIRPLCQWVKAAVPGGRTGLGPNRIHRPVRHVPLPQGNGGAAAGGWVRFYGVF